MGRGAYRAEPWGPPDPWMIFTRCRCEMATYCKFVGWFREGVQGPGMPWRRITVQPRCSRLFPILSRSSVRWRLAHVHGLWAVLELDCLCIAVSVAKYNVLWLFWDARTGCHRVVSCSRAAYPPTACGASWADDVLRW